MAQKSGEANLSTRAARNRLASSGKPYFRTLDEGLHIGYRKGSRSSAWVVRWAVGDKRYRVESLDARPDDVLEADGVTVLNWSQAQGAARTLFQRHQRETLGLEPDQSKRGPYCVRDAMADYLAWLAQHRKTTKETTYRTNAFILPELGGLEAGRLTAAKIRKWHETLAATPARLRRNAKEAENGLVKSRALDTADPEALRRRRSSANRILTILKAALNRAWREGMISTDEAWRRVQPFPGADGTRIRHLTINEARRLMNVCRPDFRNLVNAALVTGARFGELAALQACDFDPDSATVHIRTSKSGRDRRVVLNDEGRALIERLIAGKAGNARIFDKADGTPWGTSHQHRPYKEACAAAAILPSISFHELRHNWESMAIMAGAPLMVVAQNLGHSDTRMVEKHYGHLAHSFVADTIRRTAPSFGTPDSNVVPLTGRDRSRREA